MHFRPIHISGQKEAIWILQNPDRFFEHHFQYFWAMAGGPKRRGARENLPLSPPLSTGLMIIVIFPSKFCILMNFNGALVTVSSPHMHTQTFLPRDALCIVQSAVLPSHVVCPSVTLVMCDHIGWKSWKLTARTISPTPSLLVAEKRSTYSQGNMGKFGGD